MKSYAKDVACPSCHNFMNIENAEQKRQDSEQQQSCENGLIYKEISDDCDVSRVKS